jgi:hypothetical protein
LLVKRGDMAGGLGGDASGARAAAISWEEWQAGIRFSGWGEKYREEPVEVVEAALRRKLAAMRHRMIGDAAEAASDGG